MRSAMTIKTFGALLGEYPCSEYKFHHNRKWRFDYAWPKWKVALEVEGAVWTSGRHTRGSGFVRDMEKYNTAASEGWAVIRCTPQAVFANETIGFLRAAINNAWEIETFRVF
jgi:very-short-patch-repair endonuclease